VNKAGLVDILGLDGSENVHGEQVKKLDLFADTQITAALKSSGECAGIASEENEDFVSFKHEDSKQAKYVVVFDPLDGSSNIDVNVSIGTIFGIYRRVTQGGPATEQDFLQSGKNQVAAGYVIYGSSTMLVYSTGRGVNGFTLDPSIGEFCLSHPDIKIPDNSKYYSVNQGYMSKFPKGVKEYIKFCQDNDPATNRPFGLRYIGSMVADIHRNLITGGIFIYPSLDGFPDGKLRLVYECNPLSFIIEQAGGKASDGSKRILDLDTHELHQRTPIFIGSVKQVEQAERYLKEWSEKEESKANESKKASASKKVKSTS